MYSQYKDPDDDNAIPMCTLRNPTLIEHCIEWARAKFTDLFVIPPLDVISISSV